MSLLDDDIGSQLTLTPELLSSIGFITTNRLYSGQIHTTYIYTDNDIPDRTFRICITFPGNIPATHLIPNESLFGVLIKRPYFWISTLKNCKSYTPKWPISDGIRDGQNITNISTRKLPTLEELGEIIELLKNRRVKETREYVKAL